jgi:hypothetical protein
MSYKAVYLFYKQVKDMNRIKIAVEWLPDEELAKVLKTEEESQ